MIRLTKETVVRPGSVAALGTGDTIIVDRSATERRDWAAMAQALATAFVRGAEVHMGGETKDG
jgi:hypothetical protein